MTKIPRGQGPGSLRQDWETPQAMFTLLDRRYGPFSLDAAASAANRKCPQFICPPGSPDALHPDCVGEDAFAVDWGRPGEKVWINSPYGRSVTTRWAKRIAEHSISRHLNGRAITSLLPAKCGTVWFQDYLWPLADELLLIKGRVDFGGEFGAGWFESVVFHLPGRRTGGPRVYLWDWKAEAVACGLLPPSRRKTRSLAVCVPQE